MKFFFITILLVTSGLSNYSKAGVGVCEATAENESSKSRLSQSGCVNLGKMVLGSNYKGISAENIYLEKCTSRSACSSLYGKYHPGIDYIARTGTRVYSPINGKVVGIDERNGTVAIQKDGSSTRMIFGHLSEIGLSIGSTVVVGCSIGLTGSKTQFFPGMRPHLHIEARTTGNVMLGYFSSRANKEDTKDPSLIPPRFIAVPSDKVLRCPN